MELCKNLYIEEDNLIVLEKMQEGKNNTKVEKYITVGVWADNVKEAMEYFNEIERELSIKLKKINNRGLDGIPDRGNGRLNGIDHRGDRSFYSVPDRADRRENAVHDGRDCRFDGIPCGR